MPDTGCLLSGGWVWLSLRGGWGARCYIPVLVLLCGEKGGRFFVNNGKKAHAEKFNVQFPFVAASK